MNNKPRPLKNKTALITGAIHRIGFAIAEELAQQGCAIILHYHTSSESAVIRAMKTLQRYGVKTRALRADLSDEREAGALFSSLRKTKNRVDFLVNNAGIFPPSRLSSVSIRELQKTLTVNAFSPLILCRDFARRTHKGVIINILDARINRYDLSHAAYQLSKNLLYHITKMLAIEYAPGIRVNGVAPGLILPPPGEKSDYLKKYRRNNLLNTHGDPADIARAVMFLIFTPFVTGEVITVDGGQNLTKKE